MSTASKIVDKLLEGEAEEFLQGAMQADPLSRAIKAYEEFRGRHPRDFDDGTAWRVILKAIGWRNGSRTLGFMADGMVEAGKDYADEHMNEEELISAISYGIMHNSWCDATPDQVNAILTMWRAFYVTHAL